VKTLLPNLVIFDLDGTLTDTLPPTYRAFGHALAPFLGRVPTPAEIQTRFGPADHEIVADWAGPEHAEEAVARLYTAYETELATAVPFPGIPELLSELRDRGRQVALFTGRGRASTDRLLHTLAIGRYFDTTLAGEEVPASKPAPDGILLTLERLGVAPGAACYVGDTLHDVTAARGAGVAPISVLWGSPEPEVLRAAPTRVVETTEDLRRALLGDD